VSAVLLSSSAWADDEEPPRPPARPEPPVVVVSPPPPVPSPPRVEPPLPEREPEEIVHRFEASIAGTMFPAAVGDVRFTGTGAVPGMDRPSTFSHAGREIGVRNPMFWGAELALGYRHTYFGVLVSGVLATNSGADSTPTNPQAAAQISAGDITAYGGGIEIFGTVPFGRLTVSAGAAAGLRGYSAPLSGFEPKSCTRSSKRGRYTYPCSEMASTNASPWVQPRLRVDVAVDKQRMFFVGGFVGIDALGDRSVLGGLMIGLRLPKAP
jgi:hypothetical protein